MTTTFKVATESQIEFLKLLMYERLDMSMEEISGEDFSKFTLAAASGLIAEWTAMPRLRKAPSGAFVFKPKTTVPTPSEARAALAAHAGAIAVAPASSPAPARLDKEQREYPCYKCDATITGITALYAHQRTDCPKTGRNKTAPVAGGQPSAPAAPAAPRVPTPAKGRYAVIGDNGEWEFYRVTERSGHRFSTAKTLTLMKQAGDRFNFMSREAKDAIATKINADPKTAMKEYGIRLGMCGVCGRSLTDPESRSRGIGPDCWTRF